MAVDNSSADGAAPVLEYEITEMKNTCPAFAAGGQKCPFNATSSSTTNVKNCPAFSKGCPFKGVRTVHELYELFKTMPHASDSIGAAEKELVAVLHGVHAQSEKLKEQHGACPIFSNECPFKGTRPALGEAMEHRFWSNPLTEEPDQESFSKQIKEGTKVSHRAAENVHFVRNFIKGDIREDLYRQLIADLYHVYKVLEEQLEKHQQDHLIAPIHFPMELDRLATLEADMEHWFGKGWETLESTKPTPCTQEYMDRLYACTPKGLVAHAYTRYMGDLSGGQTLMRKARKALNIEGDDGVRFYVFENIPKPKPFKDMYRKALDELPIDQSEADEIIAEANIAFLMNMRLFNELDVMAGHSDTIVPLSQAIASLLVAEKPANAAECPFAKMGTMLGIPNPHANPHTTHESKAISKPTAAAGGGCPFAKMGSMFGMSNPHDKSSKSESIFAKNWLMVSLLGIGVGMSFAWVSFRK